MTTFPLRAVLCFALASVSACRQPQRQTGEPLGCGSDRDCKGERQCEEGQCVLPKTSAPVTPKSSEPALSDQDRLRALDDKERKICEERQRRYEAQHKYDLEKRQAQFEEFTAQLAAIQELQQRLFEWQRGQPVRVPERIETPAPETKTPAREVQEPPPRHETVPDTAPIETPPGNSDPGTIVPPTDDSASHSETGL